MDFDLDPWITKIETIDEIKKVEGAVELMAALKKKKVADLSCFVVPVNDAAGASLIGTGVTSQMVTERISVVFAVRSRNDQLGKGAHDRLRTLRRLIKNVLIGWLPEADEEAVIFSRGRMVDFTDQVLWWQDEYTWRYDDRQL